MDYSTILYETDAGKARITLNRPEKLNAISWQMQQELRDALWAADRDPHVHVAILRGSGRAFSSGYDITPPPGELTHAASAHSMERDIWYLEQAQQMRMAAWDMHKPVIGQVHGYCLAGGTDLVFLCDIVLAAEDARIGFPPVRAMGSPVGHMWTYLGGPQWAKRMLLTGDMISGKEAERAGFVLMAVPSDQLEAEVEALADKMALIDVDLLAANKRIVNMAMELMGARTMQRMAAERDAIGRQSPVVHEFYRRAKEEGLKAAVEWRDAKFKESGARSKGAERMGVLDKLRLHGKVAIVTGAGRGLGRAMAVALADAGADIVATARTQGQIDETAGLVRDEGRRCFAVTCDVTDSVSVKAMVEAALGEFGQIDVLVNNAGGATDGFGNTLDAITDEQWQVGVATNLTGAMYCSRAVIPHMLERGRGKIINVTSGFGLRAGRNNFIYTSAKAGLINFTRSLTMTYAPEIQANLIAPGLFPHGDPAMEDWWKHGKFVPMGRLGEDEELGPLCVLLASDLTSYMNGQIIVLDGGGLAGGQLPTGFAPVVPLKEPGARSQEPG